MLSFCSLSILRLVNLWKRLPTFVVVLIKSKVRFGSVNYLINLVNSAFWSVLESFQRYSPIFSWCRSPYALLSDIEWAFDAASLYCLSSARAASYFSSSSRSNFSYFVSISFRRELTYSMLLSLAWSKTFISFYIMLRMIRHLLTTNEVDKHVC